MAGGDAALGAATAAAATPAAAPPDAARIDAAHRAILADPTIQFALPQKSVPVEPPAPEWIGRLFRAIGRLIEWVGGGWAVIFWLLAGAALLLLVYLFHAPLRDWIAARRGRAEDAPAPAWRPDDAVARRLIEEADALAATGDYDGAVRLILLRSIEDIGAWRGGLVRRSHTSRDIALLGALPDGARQVFRGFVSAVEQSLFAGAALSEPDWHRAREDYRRFALGPTAS